MSGPSLVAGIGTLFWVRPGVLDALSWTFAFLTLDLQLSPVSSDWLP